MDFKSYPNYKDSGVEWIGNIPSDWSVKGFIDVYKNIYTIHAWPASLRGSGNTEAGTGYRTFRLQR